MLDFFVVSTKTPKKGVTVVYPKFVIKKSKDLMIRGSDFYAIWDEERSVWSQDEQDAIRLIDNEVKARYLELKEELGDVTPLYLWDASSGMIDLWHKYCQKQMRDNYHQLDADLIFANTPTKKENYASKKLSYPLEEGDISAYDKLMSTLYSPEERHKIEWAIGSIVAGDSKIIQKFLVLYGAAGTGKSTVINIIQQLFEGYCSVFDAKALGSSNNAFALEAFKGNPLVAIQHDGDLSRIEDNTQLNSIVAHELMTVNEKFKSVYSNQFFTFLFMGTNRPVRITDSKSGIVRRLIDVEPSGEKLSPKEYRTCMKHISFEIGAVAYHCREVYLAGGPYYYDDYIPTRMLTASNDFYNFVLDSYYVFKETDGVTLKAAWERYKLFCEETKIAYPYSQRVFKEELRSYFREYLDRATLDDGTRVRSYFRGFRYEKFTELNQPEEKEPYTIQFEEQASIFDAECADCFAQYATKDGVPRNSWDHVKTKLSKLDTTKLHYVRVPENHIVIDFDIPGKDGEKDFQKNLEAASKWPPTYAELSKSGAGIHLHYIYTGDPSRLSRIYEDHIEIKVFTGKSSLRRKLVKCNNLPIAKISSGLPLKGDKMVNFETIQSEKQLRRRIKKCLNKEYHPNTKPSVDFIAHLLDEAYENGIAYDVDDMRNAILAFAASSTHQSDYCIRLVNKMKFKSADPSEPMSNEEAPIVFFDTEVFPNLFLVNWKIAGPNNKVARMINPTSAEIEDLIRYRLVGFNCRRYDNHVVYARLLGYSNEQIYRLSQKIVSGSKESFFGEAYNLSYTDVYDFAAKKQSLKKWEIELGIHHKELGLPWDEPVPEDRWIEVAEYCDNDVLATEAVFDHLKGDWTARQILAEIAGMTVNDTTNSLTTRIIFGTNRKPDLVYTDLATGTASDSRYQRNDVINAFPGYEFRDGKNLFRGVDLGKGGYVYAEPGMYHNVALLDVASLHPHSIVAMNCFGEYTKNFQDLMDARIAIKHGDYEAVRHMFGGKLASYLQDESTAKDLAQALKIAINSVYGLTSANFDNPFRDIRNKNNIVALRGALFMKTLQDEVQARGFTVAHIKTDSIKIPDATPEIIQFCMEFAKQYGYEFEHEATYDRMCLVNDAVYIAKYDTGKWTATGTQFQVPFVFKTLFSHEPIEFRDMCETKSVTSGAIYLDMNEHLPSMEGPEKELAYREKREAIDDFIGYKDPAFKNVSDDELREQVAKGHNYIFVGKVGSFCPVLPGFDGGVLLREQGGKYYAVAGSKGYRWLESETVRSVHDESAIDRSYYHKLVDKAVETIAQYGDFEAFVAN